MVMKVIYQYEKGVVFTLGKYSGMLEPGLNFYIPILQLIEKVDMRIKTIDIPKQEVMTKDNVPVGVNAVVYFRTTDPKRAVLEVQDVTYAVAQYAQTALRDIIGNSELDAVLTEREKIADAIKSIVDREIEPWGIDVTAIKIQDIELPDNMKRAMARQAEAERERRAIIIMSEGELKSADNLADAAQILHKSPGAMHLRSLQAISDVSSDPSNAISFLVPIELANAIEGFAIAKKGKEKK